MSKPTISRVTPPQIPRKFRFETQVTIERPLMKKEPSGVARKMTTFESLSASTIDLKVALKAISHDSPAFSLMKTTMLSDVIDRASLLGENQEHIYQYLAEKKDYSGPSM